MDRDLGYQENRRILRQYYINDPGAHKAVKTLAFAIKDKITHPIVSKLMDHEIIIKYLIDGYLAFEIIDDNNLIEIDPATLQCTHQNNRLLWLQYITSLMSNPRVADREIENDKMLYISYYGDEMSFLASVHSGLIRPDDKEFILSHVDFIIDRFSTKRLRIEEILHTDAILKRGLKIRKLKLQ